MKPNFIILEFENKKYNIDPYSVWAEKQLVDKYGDKLSEMFLAPQNEIILSEVIYICAEDALRRDYPTLDIFQRRLISPAEKYAVVNCAWAIVAPAIAVVKTAEEIEEEKLIKKKETFRSHFRNFWKTLVTGLTKHLGGRMNISTDSRARK